MTQPRKADFPGFPARSRQTPIPNLFFTAVLPEVDDITELKVCLGLFWKLSWKKGYPRFVTLKEMAGDLDLMTGLSHGGADPSARLQQGLERSLARGTFLHLALERPTSLEKSGAPAGKETEHLYFLNTDADRSAINRVRSGEVDLGALPKVEAMPEPPEHRNIFGLYEENIGVLTPLIAEELKEAEREYPFAWIVEAFKEAVRMDRRRWRYIQRILEHWKAEGLPHGRPARDTQATHASGQQPERERRGGYIVKRRS